MATAILVFIACAAVITFSGIRLSRYGDIIKEKTGLRGRRIGRRRAQSALDMAAGNLLSSNLFNIAALGLDDVLFTRGPLRADVAPSHLIGAAAAISMSAVAVIGLTYRAQRKSYRLSWETLGILAIYGVTLMLLATSPSS